MSALLTALERRATINEQQDAKENSSIHIKRYLALEQLIKVHPTVPRWIVVNRWLEPQGRVTVDAVLAPTNAAADVFLSPAIQSSVHAANKDALDTIKGRQTIYSEPSLKSEKTQYTLKRRIGPTFTITASQYERLNRSTAPQGKLGRMHDLLCRYQPFIGVTFNYLEAYYEQLKESYHVTTHLLSTPLHRIYDSYGSLYFDVDSGFGSLGCLMYDNDPIVDKMRQGGSFELTGLLLGELPDPLLFRLEQLLPTIEAPIQVIVLLAGKVEREGVDYQHYFQSANHTILVYRKGYQGLFDAKPLMEYFKLIGPIDQEEQVEVAGLKVSYPRPTHNTLPYLTIYEKARVIGERANQFVRGGVLMIEAEGEYDLLVLAERELKAKKMPITLRRTFPNGEFEDHQVNSLYDINF